MKNLSALLLIILFFNTGYAQTDSTIYNKWIPSLRTTLNISQIAFSNWTKGGENSLAWSVEETFILKYTAPYWNVKNELSSAYGQTKVGGRNFRVTDNELYMETLISYGIGWKVDPYISNTVRTQVTAGYTYTDTSKTEVTNFFDPAYLTQSLGFTYDRLKNFQTRLGIGLEEVITNRFRRYSDDPETPDIEESFNIETGIESTSDAQFSIDKNLTVKSKLRLFSAFDRLETWDVRWDNVITGKVNNWLSVKFTYLLVFQKDQSPTAQMKQALQVGITYTIL